MPSTTTTTTVTFRVECDDVALMAVDANDPDNRVVCPWPTWFCNLDDEAEGDEYNDLSDEVCHDLLNRLAELDYTVTDRGQVVRAVQTAVHPGGIPDEKDLQFEAVAKVEREVVVTGWDGHSNPITRYADELHLPDHQRAQVRHGYTVDKVSVPVSEHGAAEGKVTVEIDDPYGEGNRQTDLPTILVSRGISWSLRLTWDEARALAAAITEVTDIAENG